MNYYPYFENIHPNFMNTHPAVVNILYTLVNLVSSLVNTHPSLMKYLYFVMNSPISFVNTAMFRELKPFAIQSSRGAGFISSTGDTLASSIKHLIYFAMSLIFTSVLIIIYGISYRKSTREL